MILLHELHKQTVIWEEENALSKKAALFCICHLYRFRQPVGSESDFKSSRKFELQSGHKSSVETDRDILF